MNRLKCCTPSVAGQINGRTLRKAVQTLADGESAAKFGKFENTEWVSICPVCDAAILDTPSVQWPYQCDDGAMRTVRDFDACTGTYSTPTLTFGCFGFSKLALESAINQQKAIQKTADTESVGRQLLQRIISETSTEDDCFAFSQSVHDWGAGGRVWGNLLKQQRSTLRNHLKEWLSAVPALDVVSAIEKGVAIKGLAVSFASKHLRMLQPERFAVLDDVLCQGLGFALNPRGYEFFMKEVGAFQRAQMPQESVAYVEAGLFLLVRQGVRSVASNERLLVGEAPEH
ncbi:hypothetical protein [Caballeronia sp. Lep1P3]|uniref:hypothetical protein n=1 Tax=Caballeronia sp. Lep1P3 TaxID=2878150 RepID=UPI001FD4D249|nr:hypothetical protein [Caballeronia sp. Lep1P3]